MSTETLKAIVTIDGVYAHGVKDVDEGQLRSLEREFWMADGLEAGSYEVDKPAAFLRSIGDVDRPNRIQWIDGKGREVAIEYGPDVELPTYDAG